MMKNLSKVSGWIHGGLWIWGDAPQEDQDLASVSVEAGVPCYWELTQSDDRGHVRIAKFPEEGLTNWEFAW